MANGPAEQIGIGRALARLAIAKAFRTTITLSHRGATAVTLAARIIGDWNTSEVTNGVLTEQRYLKIFVTANQPGFQPAANDSEVVLVGDIITCSKYANRTYQVIEIITLDVAGRVYTLTCVENKRLAAGIG